MRSPRNLLTLMLASGGCSGGGGASPPVIASEPVTAPAAAQAIDTAAQAVARFDALYGSLSTTATDAQRATLADLDRERQHGRGPGPSVSRRACAEVSAWVTSVLGTDRAPVLAGTVAALDTAGTAPCWVVGLSAGFTTLLVALAAADGALLIAWLPPEG